MHSCNAVMIIPNNVLKMCQVKKYSDKAKSRVQQTDLICLYNKI